MSSTPDLKNPLPSWLVPVVSVTALTAAGLGGLVLYVGGETDAATEQQRLVVQSGLPTDFFGVAKQEDLPAEAPIVEAPTPPPPAVEPRVVVKTVYRDRPKDDAAEERARRQAALARAAANPYAAFGATPPETEAQRRARLLREINQQRRAANFDRPPEFTLVAAHQVGPDGEAAAAGTSPRTKPKTWAGVAKDIASYPIELERVITVDRFIPALIVQDVQSELGGKVVAQVERNVYGAHGRFVLIPAGSRAVGYYQPLKKAGQTRIQIRWFRLITPDGINISFQLPAEMADAMGRSGITGDVDNKYFEKYGAALLISTLNAAGAMSIEVDNLTQAIILENYGSELSRVTGRILEENIDIAPTVSIPAGSRILISPLTDIWFREPEGNQVVGVPFEPKENKA